MNETIEYEIQASGNSHKEYPMDVVCGLLWYNESETICIPKKIPFGSIWGNPETNIISLKDEIPVPYKLNLIWISVTESKSYEIECTLPIEVIQNKMALKSSLDEQLFTHIVIGMAPLGKIAIWLWGYERSILLSVENGNEIHIDLKSVYPTSSYKSLREYCEYLLVNKCNRLTDSHLDLMIKGNFSTMMKKYVFRYLINMGEFKDGEFHPFPDNMKWGEIVSLFNYCMDGTHDKSNTGELYNFHESGIPEKIHIKWESLKKDFELFIWLEATTIISVFERFYGAHPETKTDFIIRIDAENKKYELALYRQGLKEPVVIPESAYQMIIFKNKFEDYRSDNYNQPRGAWIW